MHKRIISQCFRLPARLITSTALVACLVPLTGAADSLLEANVLEVKPGENVPVARIPDDVYLRSVNDPDDTIWERLPEYRVHLSPAPSVHRSVELRRTPDDAGTDMIFTVARTSERLYLRFRWRDATRDVQTLKDQFRDGVAAQFSLGDSSTSFMMGTGPETPVNIWYWHPDGNQVESLGAGGFGSTTRLDEQPVSAASQYQDRGGEASEWIVVMSRPLSVDGEYQVNLEQDTVPVALAVWQGAEGERDGLKSVTFGWLNLQMKAAS